jgi:4-hydroxy-tetrahydrodipicolinate synthase
MMVFGYATEFLYLSRQESGRLLESVIGECRGRVPVIASVTAESANQAKKDAERYQDMGAGAVMLLPRSGGPREYITTAASGTALPVLIQYAPNMTGVFMNAAEIAEIAKEIGRPFGVKSETSMEFITELLEASDNLISVYAGMQGIQMREALERGALGIMPGCSRVGAYKKIYDEYAYGSKEKAFELFDRFLSYLRVFHGQFELFYEKYILVKRKIFSTVRCRQPVVLPEASVMAEFEKYYEITVNTT